MAKKVKTNEYSGFEELSEEVKTEAVKKHIAWENQSNLQRLDSVSTYQAMIINKVAGIARDTNDRSGVFWEKPATSDELDKSIPYNGETGMPYTNLDNILMRSVMAIEKFKEPVFLTVRQANKMGGTLKKTGELTRNGKDEYVLGVKIVQLKTHEFVPELNEDGTKKKIPVLDEDGNVVLNQKTGEEIFKVAGEFKELKEPMYESVSLYNVEQFDNLDRSKLKTLNLAPLHKKRESIAKNPEAKLNYKLGMLKGKTGTLTLQNLYKFLEATQTGKEFAPQERAKINMGATKEFVNEKPKEQGFSR